MAQLSHTFVVCWLMYWLSTFRPLDSVGSYIPYGGVFFRTKGEGVGGVLLIKQRMNCLVQIGIQLEREIIVVGRQGSV